MSLESAIDTPTSQDQLLGRIARGLSSAAREHVPTFTLLDYAFGGLDDELLNALHGEHIRNCPTCTRGVERYRRQRPNPAHLTDVPELSHCVRREETYDLLRTAKKRLLRFIAEEPGELLVVAGEANPAVYDQELGEALRQRARESRRGGVPLPRVICGPAMGLGEEIQTSADAILPILAREGALRLYIAAHRQKIHFRVSGERFVYTEAYHAAGYGGKRTGVWYEGKPIAGLFRRRFDAILKTGLARLAKSGEDFVYLPMERIRAIQEQRGEAYDSMTAPELRACLS